MVLINRKYYSYYVLIIALIIRFLFAYAGYVENIWEKFADDNARLAFAHSIIENGFVSEHEDYMQPQSVFAPIVPTVLAISLFLFGNNWLPIFILNTLIGALSCTLIYKFAILFFNKKVSLIAGLWAALYPNFIRYTATAGNEVWIVFLFVLTSYVLVKVILNQDKKHYKYILPFVFVLLIHTDERYLTYGLLFTLLLFFSLGTLKTRIYKALIFIVFGLVFSLPWIVRNYFYYNDLVLISIRTTGITNPILKHRPELLSFDHTPNTKYLTPSQIDSVKNGILTTYPDGRKIKQGKIEAIKSGDYPHLFSRREALITRIKDLWIPTRFEGAYRITGYNFMEKWSLKHNLSNIFTYGVLLPFVLLAFYMLVRKKQLLMVIIFGSILLFHTLIHLIFIPYTRDRYRHPIDFIIIILGVYGALFVYNFLIKKDEKLLTYSND